MEQKNEQLNDFSNEPKVQNERKFSKKTLKATLKEVFSLSFVKDLKWYEWVIIAMMAISQLILTILTEINAGSAIFNFSISLAGFLYLVCASRCSFWIFVFGLYQPLAYGFVCLNNGLYGEMLVNFAYFAPIQLLGIFLWLNNYKRRSSILCENLYVRRLSRKSYYILIPLVLVTFVLIYFVLTKLNGQRLPILDAFISTMSLLGTGLLTLRYVENWIAYLVVNISSLALWIVLAIEGSGDAPYFLILNIAYVIYSLIGLTKWGKAVKN